jgi:hypothetical protein
MRRAALILTLAACGPRTHPTPLLDLVPASDHGTAVFWRVEKMPARNEFVDLLKTEPIAKLGILHEQVTEFLTAQTAAGSIQLVRGRFSLDDVRRALVLPGVESSEHRETRIHPLTIRQGQTIHWAALLQDVLVIGTTRDIVAQTIDCAHGGPQLRTLPDAAAALSKVRESDMLLLTVGLPVPDVSNRATAIAATIEPNGLARGTAALIFVSSDEALRQLSKLQDRPMFLDAREWKAAADGHAVVASFVTRELRWK